MTNIITDFTAVERMLPLLPYVANGEIPPDQLFDRLIETDAIKIWFEHVSRRTKFTKHEYRQLMKQAVSCQEPPHYWAQILRRNAHRVDQFSQMLKELKALDLGITAYDQANSVLDVPFDEPVNLYYVCAIRGSAIVLDHNIVIDIADLPDPFEEPLPVWILQATIAHELFHMGRQAMYRSNLIEHTKPRDLPGHEGAAADLTMVLVEEGSATYYFSMESNQHKLGERWTQLFDNLPDISERFASLLLQALNQDVPAEEAFKRGYGFFGLEGYALGCKMCEAIDKVLGREVLQRCLRQPFAFYRVYNQAVKEGDLDLPLFPDELAQRVAGLL